MGSATFTMGEICIMVNWNLKRALGEMRRTGKVTPSQIHLIASTAEVQDRKITQMENSIEKLEDRLTEMERKIRELENTIVRRKL